MKQYKSVKTVHAEQMTSMEAIQKELIREDQLSKYENHIEDGYKVVYEDGYESWSPAKPFEEGYVLEEEGELGGYEKAVSEIKKGRIMSREAWHGTPQSVYLVVPNSYPMSNNLLETMNGVFKDNMVPYQGYIAFVSNKGDVVPYAPTHEDQLANDWFVVR